MGKEPNRQPVEDLAYYLTLFKLEGHTTWRASLKNKKDGFDHEVKTSATWPKITDRIDMRIDRLTGLFSQI